MGLVQLGYKINNPRSSWLPRLFSYLNPNYSLKNLLGKSFNTYKPQVQAVSLSTRVAVRRELCFQLPNYTRPYQARQIKDEEK